VTRADGSAAPPRPGLRPPTAIDLPALVALNNTFAAEVNELSPLGLARLFAVAAYTRMTEDGAAFLFAFSEATPIQGPNHAWFAAREPRSLYVDRVVVAPHAQGRGLGRALYDDLAAAAGDRPLCCEVNLAPPNPQSHAFHLRLGFAPVGEAIDPRNGKRVQYLLRRPDRRPA
jgi:hypothetical protein